MSKKNPNLTAEQKLVFFEEGTEPPGSSELNYEKREGSYYCANCDIKPSIRSVKEKQEHLFEPPTETILPPLNLLDEPGPSVSQYSKETLEAMSRQVELKLKDFGGLIFLIITLSISNVFKSRKF